MTLRPVVTLRILLALGLAVALFFPAFYGDDGFNTMSQTEVATVTSFLQTAAPGPVYCAVDNAPLADTAGYVEFPLTTIFGASGLMGAAPVTPDIATTIASLALSRTGGRQPAYVLVTPGMLAYSQAYGLTPSKSFAILLAALAHTPAWKLVDHRAGTVIYELPPTAPPKARSGQASGPSHGRGSRPTVARHAAAIAAHGPHLGDLVGAGGYH